jgi:serine/threonine protein kinase
MNPQTLDEQSKAWLEQLKTYALQLAPEQREDYVRQACGEREDLLAVGLQMIRGTQSPTKTMSGKTAQMIGPYKVIRELGKGGMGIVYLAMRDDGAFRKNVALKLLRGDAVTAEFVERFRNERQVLANFDHPNIARILDGGDTTDGMPFYVMEYVEGRPLDRYCDEEKLSLNDRLRLYIKLCDAVHYLHQNQVIHRDLKPGNVMVANDGTVKLLDFGIAKQLGPASMELTTADGTPLTPAYASPEQFTGRADARSDIYTLGVILYLLLAGRLPDQGTTKPPSESVREDYQRTQETTKQLKQKMAGDLDGVVLKAMARESRLRYATAKEFAEDLQRVIDGKRVQAAGASSSTGGGPKLGLVAAALVLVLAGGAGVYWWTTQPKAQPIAGEEAPKQKGSGTGGMDYQPPLSSSPVDTRPIDTAPTVPVAAGSGSKMADAPLVTQRPPAGSSVQPDSRPVAPAPTMPANNAQTPVPVAPATTVPAPQAAQQAAPAVVEGLDEARDKYSSISGRVASTEQMFNKIKQDLEAKGLSVRPDTLARVMQMKMSLEQAKTELDRGNVAGALRNLTAAEAQSNRVNKEFGR